MTIHNEMFDENKTGEDRPTVMVSGGFDPVHAGHIRMIRAAAEHGDVIVYHSAIGLVVSEVVLHINQSWNYHKVDENDN